MTGDKPVTGGPDPDSEPAPRSRATIRTSHERPSVVAAAVRPDNTAEMTTRVVDGTVETTVERDSADGLRATVDDYVVNLRVADRLTTIDGQSESSKS